MKYLIWFILKTETVIILKCPLILVDRCVRLLTFFYLNKYAVTSVFIFVFRSCFSWSACGLINFDCVLSQLISTAAIFLAGKSEETPCPLNSVLRASSEILFKKDFTLLSYLLPLVSRLQNMYIFVLLLVTCW